MKLSEFAKEIVPDLKLYPHQKMLMDMVEKLPKGAKIKTDLTARNPPRVWAIKDGVRLEFSGENWVAV
ncbi:hypothetical protein [Endozoicomonas sp. SESOKO3]|uniref:hypothetical protein n=1 Tax=Endozoicomonas sp. SESOKO3 TaxID=2828744 RepID=UPI002148885C|nr:hypothetical protein [Endozoicomonas sp. SESOKO3]